MTDRKQIDDGGMAYPGRSFSPNGYPEGHSMGMSVRDWFAGQALASIMQDKAIWDCREDERYDVAIRMYGWADAMIAARKGGVK